jgi:predicted transcriptional regulator
MSQMLREMSDSTVDSSKSPVTTPSAVKPKLDPVSVLFALGSDVRWPIVNMLADGKVLSIGQVASALGRDIDGIGKQLKVLADAGVAEASAGKDRRQTVYSIPAVFRPAPGVLDFGFCVVDLRKG